MCHQCPTEVSYRDHGQTLLVERCPETLATPSDLTNDPMALDDYRCGERWLVTLRATLRGAGARATFELHGVPDGKGPGQCALGNACAMKEVVSGVMAEASRAARPRRI